MPACPICSTVATTKREGSPYWVCPMCDLWFQSPLPAKVSHGPHEPPGDAMGEFERNVNRDLAVQLFAEVMRSRPGWTLDVGANYPALAAALGDLGCFPIALDSSPDSEAFARALKVMHCAEDFETAESLNPGTFALVTFVHSFEHLYAPVAALRRARRLIASDGAIFIRMPDHRVPGYERDLTEGHYMIHPYYHTLASVLQALAETRETFAVASERPLIPGQRDIVLRPL